MKSKVGAIKIIIISIFFSGILYLECQWDFFISYKILKVFKYMIKVCFLILNSDNNIIYVWSKNIYLWLLNQPTYAVTKTLEMVSSGVFGSALVTGIIYYTEYKIQNKINIRELVKLQKAYIERVNELTFVSSFISDTDNIARKAYLEYAENSWKLREHEHYKQRINSRKGMSRRDKEKQIQKHIPVFKHEAAEVYKKWVWDNMDEKEKEEILLDEYKEQYLFDAFETLVAKTDLEIIAAFYDYREISEIDVSEIQELVEEIQFIGFKKKEKKRIIDNAIRMDKKYIQLISNSVVSNFEIEDLYDYFRGNRRQLLEKIEYLQKFFFEEKMQRTKPANKYEEWIKQIGQKIFHDGCDQVQFKSPQNFFEVFGSGYALSPVFLKKARIQGWDYNKYLCPDLKILKY